MSNMSVRKVKKEPAKVDTTQQMSSQIYFPNAKQTLIESG